MKPTLLDLRSPGTLQELDFANKILLSDTETALSRFPDNSIDCSITSPPYWNFIDYGYQGQVGLEDSYARYRDRLTGVWGQVARVLKPNSKFCLNVPLLPIKKEVSKKAFGASHTRVLLDLYADLKADILANTDLQFYSLYIWEKQTTKTMFGSYPYPPNLYERNYIEFIAVFVKPGKPTKRPKYIKEAAKLTQKEWLNLTKQIWWMYPANVGRKKGHPAPFPELLPNRLINMYTFPAATSKTGEQFLGDIVLDPFVGWGTTCVAAKRCGRQYVGVDLSPDFCKIAVAKLAETEIKPGVGLVR
jgi:DNA modification methylase